MAFSILKYQKSSLTLIATILLSVSSASQAGYFSKYSSIKLCMQKGMGMDEQTFLSYPDMVAYWGDYDTYYEELNPDSLREDLRAQTYAQAWSALFGFNLQPTLIKTEALIMHPNTESVSMYTPFQYDKDEVLSDPGSFYTESSVRVSSFGVNQSLWQVLTGATTISSPGIQYHHVLTTRLMNIPSYPDRSKVSCDSSSKMSYNKLN